MHPQQNFRAFYTQKETRENCKNPFETIIFS